MEECGAGSKWTLVAYRHWDQVYPGTEPPAASLQLGESSSHPGALSPYGAESVERVYTGAVEDSHHYKPVPSPRRQWSLAFTLSHSVASQG